MPAGRSVPLTDVGNQSPRGIVGQYHRVVAADHDWHAKKIVSSIKNCMNITETYCEWLYSSGSNGLGRNFCLDP